MRKILPIIVTSLFGGKQQDNGLETERSQYPILYCLSLSVAEYRKTTNSQPVTIFLPMFLLRLLRLVFTIALDTHLLPSNLQMEQTSIP